MNKFWVSFWKQISKQLVTCKHWPVQKISNTRTNTTLKNSSAHQPLLVTLNDCALSTPSGTTIQWFAFYWNHSMTKWLKCKVNSTHLIKTNYGVSNSICIWIKISSMQFTTLTNINNHARGWWRGIRGWINCC